MRLDVTIPAVDSNGLPFDVWLVGDSAGSLRDKDGARYVRRAAADDTEGLGFADGDDVILVPRLEYEAALISPNVPQSVACPPPGSRVGARALEPPLRSHARLVVHDEGHLDVEIRGVRFCFRQARRGWEGGCAVVLEPIELDEKWLTKAREVATAVASAHLEGAIKRGDPVPVPCPDCGAQLAAPLVADYDAAHVEHVRCLGGLHEVEWSDQRLVQVDETGAAIVVREAPAV